MKKFCLFALIWAMAVFAGCGGGKEERRAPSPDEMPENIISYEEKEDGEFIPVTEAEEHDVVEPDAADDEDDLPSPEELGEYQEIFMEGDILDDGSVGGWVIKVSLNEITVNTYNELTTYVVGDEAKGAADRLKPGDAVLVTWHEDGDGRKVADELGRVRVEDEALTKDEIEEMYKNANAGETGGTEQTDE